MNRKKKGRQGIGRLLQTRGKGIQTKKDKESQGDKGTDQKINKKGTDDNHGPMLKTQLPHRLSPPLYHPRRQSLPRFVTPTNILHRARVRSSIGNRVVTSLIVRDRAQIATERRKESESRRPNDSKRANNAEAGGH
jgi:hypothetical protein